MPDKLETMAVPGWMLRARVSPVVLEYGLLGLVFVVSRLALHAAGLRFEMDLRWMFLADTAALRDHLFQTFLYFHAYPPGMNLLTGVLLKWDAEHIVQNAQLVLSAFAFVLVASLHYIARACGLSRGAALTLAAVFCLLPQTIYLEHLYLYSIVSAALLCLSAALFHRAVGHSSPARWFLFFSAAVVLCWFRSTFHLLWFLVILALAFLATLRRLRRHVLLGAAAPTALLVGLYGKNLALFHVFGTTSWSGANLVTITTRQLPDEEREALVAAGKLSPLANISVYAGPERYSDYMRDKARPSFAHFPGSDDVRRPTTNAANYNHWYFLEVNEDRRKDSLYYLSTHFGDYIGTVLHKSLPQFFSSTTHWHPFDNREEGPHFRHRQVLGHYEALYDRVVHGFPLAPVGLYLLLPVFLLWAAVRAWSLIRSGDAQAWTTGMLFVFCILQILYVTTVSILMTYGESARYRFMVEAFVWLLAAVCVSHGVRWIGRRWPG